MPTPARRCRAGSTSSRERVDEPGRSSAQHARSRSATARAAPAASRVARTQAEVAAYLATRAPATYAAARTCAATDPPRAARLAATLAARPRRRARGSPPGRRRRPGPTSTAITLVEAEPAMVVRRARARRPRRRPAALGSVARAGRCGGADAGGARDRLVSRSASSTPPALTTVHRARLVVCDRHPRRRRARHDRGLRAVLAARAPRRRGRHRARAVPARRAVPAARRRLVPLLRPPPPHPAPPGGEGGRAGLRGREARYVVLCRSPQPRPEARVIRRPDPARRPRGARPLHDEGPRAATVSKKDGADYKQARKLGWGDAL